MACWGGGDIFWHAGRDDLRQERRVARARPTHALSRRLGLVVGSGRLHSTRGGPGAFQVGVGMQAEGWAARTGWY